MARTGENIYKRKDKRWEARYIYAYDSLGKAKYRYLYAKTYTAVKQKLRAAMTKNQQNQPIETIGRFSDAAQRWLNNAHLRVKASSWIRYRNLVDIHICPYLGQHPADKITTEQLENFLRALLGSSLSPRMAADILTVTKSILKYVHCAGQIDWDQLKVKKRRPEMRVLTKLEQEKLHQVLFTNTDTMKLGVLLSLYTGIRVGELCALRWENINLAERTLHITGTLQRIQRTSPESGAKTEVVITAPKSDRGVRIIPLPGFLLAQLSQHLAAPQAFILTGESNYSAEPRTVQNHFKKCLRAANVPDANYHSTRHTFATRCVELGFEIKSLSEILGHSSVQITLERYVHSSFELKRENMDKLSPDFSLSPSK
jgi:integrase